jgi:3' terminal RNA ribose 2'-O-methyltransferase Hen1
MLVTVTTTREPATDLGYLLHKHPGRAQVFDLPVGVAHVFYPAAGPARCTAALLLEVDPVALVRGRKGPPAEGFALGQYVNDRPYAASSMLAVALGKVFGTAMSGRCDPRPALAASPLPLEIAVPALPCRGGPELAERVFAPLGWSVEATPIALDPTIPSWGPAPYVDLRLRGEVRLADALHHLYVLLPVLDDAKHYWIGPDEVDKLIRAGAGWLATHPERALITRRYLARRTGLYRSAMARLAEVDDTEPEALDNATDPPTTDPPTTDPPTTDIPTADIPTADGGPEPRESLARQRRGAVLAVLRSAGARRVADLGCGEGALLALLLDDAAFTEVVGSDVSARALERAGRRLGLERMPAARRDRLRLFQSALTYRDARLTGFDAAVLCEVIEHVEPDRLPALERVVFGYATPGTVIVTTPNIEYNVRYEWQPAGGLRHRDHRFEWTRAQFRAWGERVAASYGYALRVLPVGPDDPDLGPPTQLAVFTRRAGTPRAAGTEEVA